MNQSSAQLKIRISAMPQEDKERLEEITHQLRQELLGLDIENVVPQRAGEVPEGARGDPFTIGTLIVTLAASGGVLTKLIDTLQSWLNNRARSALTIELDGDKITLDGNPTSSHQQLIDLFISRHTK